MDSRLFLAFIALVLVSASVFSAPLAPTGIMGELSGGGVKISWQHNGGEGTSFNVYRGTSIEDMQMIATVSENFFVDKGTVAGQEYTYFVTAFDASGESEAKGSIAVVPIEQHEKPFTVTLLEPAEKSFQLGLNKRLEFVLRLESNRFEDLQNLKAVLVNGDFGLQEEFVFDIEKKLFALVIDVPEKEAFEVLQTTYLIQVTATVNGEQVSESMEVNMAFIPKTEVDFTTIIQLVVLLFAAGSAFCSGSNNSFLVEMVNPQKNQKGKIVDEKA